MNIRTICVIGFILSLATESQAITIIASGAGYYSRPRINNNGEIVWSQRTAGEYQIWSNQRGQITSGPLDRDPDINDAGEIIWRFGDGGGGPDGISSNTRGLIYAESEGGIDPYYDTHRINNTGEIVWSDGTGDIWSNTRGQLTTNNSGSDRQTAINDLGEIVFGSYSFAPGRNTYDILSTDRGFITNDSAWESHPDINNAGEVVWQQRSFSGGEWEDWEIWSNIRGTITANNSNDTYPSINNSGEIVWQYWDGQDYEIVSSVRGQITNNDANDIEPHINDLGMITWVGDNFQTIYFIPEPTTFIIMSLGLTGLGIIGRHRK